MALIHREGEAVEREATLSSQQHAGTYEALMVRALRGIDDTLRTIQFAHAHAGEDYLQALEESAFLPPSELFTIAVTDALGIVVFSNREDGFTGFAAADEFTTLQSADVLTISDPFRVPGQEVPVVHFGRRLENAGGEFTGAAFIATDISYFVANYETIHLGEEGLLAMVKGIGMPIVVRQGDVISTGEALSLATLDFSAVPTEDPVVMRRTDAVDGVERFVAAYQVFEYPLTIVAGLSVEEALAAFRDNRRFYLASSVTASGVLLILMSWLGYQSYRLDAARRLAFEIERAHSKKVEHQALHDSLTGLPNRILFTQLVKQGIRNARRRQSGLAVLFMDLDHFKKINDTLGHEAGDEMLKKAADRLRDCFRKSDTIARFGGDEFVALMPDLDSRTDAELLAAKILEALKPPFTLAGEFLQVTSSVGIALYPEDGEDDVTLLKRADIALYAAKDGGRDRFVFFADLSAKPSSIA